MPEWPIGTALKAVAGRNVSRGFESRPLCVTRYRLDRTHLMVAAGVCFLIAAACVLVAFLANGVGRFGDAISAIAAVLAVVLMLLAAVINLRPPTVLTLDPQGFITRGRGENVSWKSVENFSIAGNMLRFSDTTGAETGYDLNFVEKNQRADLIREIYDRLNTANGYRRFDPSA